MDNDGSLLGEIRNHFVGDRAPDVFIEKLLVRSHAAIPAIAALYVCDFNGPAFDEFGIMSGAPSWGLLNGAIPRSLRNGEIYTILCPATGAETVQDASHPSLRGDLLH